MAGILGSGVYVSIVANIDHPKVICHCNILILHNFSTLCTCLLQCISRKVLKINVFQTVAYWWCGGPLQILWCMEINLLHKIQLEKKNKLFFFLWVCAVTLGSISAFIERSNHPTKIRFALSLIVLGSWIIVQKREGISSHRILWAILCLCILREGPFLTTGHC